MNILLVGGAVRNLLLGRPVVDKDFLVNGISKEVFAQKYPQAKEVGEHFPVFLINGDEYAFLRAESLEKDFLSRDFTINAIAIDENGELFAHPEALTDLHNRRLAPASDISFKIDPLRVFRAARFLSELDDFTPTQDLLEKMRQASVNGLTETVAGERVGKELLRALNSRKPSKFLEYLSITKNISPWFKEYEDAAGIPAGSSLHHDKSVLGHTMEVMDRLAGKGPLRVFMGMVHDIGKNVTAPDMLSRDMRHENKGEEMAASLALRLRLSNKYVKAGSKAARWYMVAADYQDLRAETKVDLLSALGGAESVADLFAVAHADRTNAPDHTRLALADYATIKSVRLPKKYHNQGARSGAILHRMRADALRKGQSTPS